MTETEHGTNGVVIVRELRAPTLALWPATSQLGTQRVSLGRTMTVGTEGLSQAAGMTTNDVQALSLVLRLLGR